MQLYINTYGTYVHVKDDMFEILIRAKDKPREKRHFSAKKVQSIVLAEHTAVSAAAVKLAVMNNVDILFVNYDGRPLGRVWHSKMGSTSKIRKAQLEASMGKSGFSAVKEWLCTKIENEADFLKRLKKHRKKHHDFINNKIKKIEDLAVSMAGLDAENIRDVADTARGIEGTSGRLFFETLSYIMPKEHQFNGRSSRPAKDGFNAFLNYAYGVLYSTVEKALIIAGLDPYLGYMHRDDYNQLSFVFDFIEPYRIYPIEIVFKLFSGKKVNKSHINDITNGVSLNKSGKELLMDAYNNFMDIDTVRYRGRNQTRNNTIQFDAHKYANSLIKNSSETEDVSDIDKMFEL